MISSSKLKSVDFYRKIPRDLTEASISGAGLSIIAALSMIFLFGMEFSNYLSVSTSTTVIVDKSSDGDFLRIDFNMSFPALSCEFASVDISDVLGTNRLNISKTIRKYSIDHDLKMTGSEFHSGPVVDADIKHGDDVDEEYGEGSIPLTSQNFDRVSHMYPIVVVNFYAPWCYWSNRLKPSWEKAAKIIRERYDPEMDGRIILAKVDCTEANDLCRRNHIQGYPSIRIFRKGSDLRDDHGQHEHESYYGDRDTDSLVKTMDALVSPIPVESDKHALDKPAETAKRPAPLTGGCRIEGFVRVKKVPGNLIISARSGAHSFDTTQLNMSHIVSHLSFGRKISPRVMSDAKRLIPYLGGSHDKLNGRAFINQHDLGANVTIEHYLQIVKTEVITRGNHKLVEEYEYTAHSSLAQTVYIPVTKFHFELSPMQLIQDYPCIPMFVKANMELSNPRIILEDSWAKHIFPSIPLKVLITENPKSFSHFITNVCAIIGGVFTVAGILDSILHNTIRLVKKVELGKNI